MFEDLPLWTDAHGLIHDQPQPRESENASLYTVLYAVLSSQLIGSDVNLPDSSFLAAHANVLPNGDLTYNQAPWLKFKASHDNATALICLAERLRLYHNSYRWHELKILGQYWHPRDIIFYGYVQRKWWSYPLLPVLFLIFLVTVLTKYKTRPTLINWAKSGFKATRIKILKTDTEILMWLRFRLLDHRKCITFMAKLLEPMLNKRFGFESKHPVYILTLCSLYFQQPDPCVIHPIVYLARRYFSIKDQEAIR